MFDSGIALLEWLGIIAFAITGALVASRNQMDAVGFVLLGTVTGIGGGTLRDLLLDLHPLQWIEQPAYIAACGAISLLVFFTAHLVNSRYRLILWLDAVGLALFAALGAERTLATGAAPVVAVILGVITATFAESSAMSLGRSGRSSFPAKSMSRRQWLRPLPTSCSPHSEWSVKWRWLAESSPVSCFGPARSAGAGYCRATVRGQQGQTQPLRAPTNLFRLS